MGMVSILVMWPGQFKHIFVSEGYMYMKYGYNRVIGVWGNVWICKIMVVPGSKVKQWPWPFFPQIFTYLLRQLYLPFLFQDLQNFPLYPMYLHFPIFDLAVKQSRPTQGHHLNILGSTQVPNATYQVPRPSVNWFWSWIFLKVFTIYAHLGHVTLFICINFHSHSPISFYKKFGSKRLNSFWEKQVLILKSEWPSAKVNILTLTFDTHLTSLTHLFEYLNQLRGLWL